MKLKSRGSIRFITIKSIEDFQIVAGKSVENVFPMHVHEKFCIGFVQKGTALIVHKNKTTHLCNESIYFINPGEAHQIKPADKVGFDHVVFCFGFEFLRSYFNGTPNESTDFRFNKSIISSCDVRDMFLSFYEMALKKVPYINLEYKLMEIFSGIYDLGVFENTQIADKEHTLITHSLCEYIKENCNKNLSLDEIASYAHLSKFHFSRVFKNVVGISPYDFELQARLKLSRNMLLQGIPIADIAVELGFTDQSHFSKLFRRNMGVTPAWFVKMNLKV